MATINKNFIVKNGLDVEKGINAKEDIITEGKLKYKFANGKFVTINVTQPADDTTVDLSGSGTIALTSDLAFYDLSFEQEGGDNDNAILRLAGSGADAVNNDLSIIGGTNVTVTRDSTTQITISSVDTTYTAGKGLALSGVDFSLDFSELTDKTADVTANTEIILQDEDGFTTSRKAIGEIKLSAFANDLGNYGGFLTAESDTLATVTGRGNTTTTNITANQFIATGGVVDIKGAAGGSLWLTDTSNPGSDNQTLGRIYFGGYSDTGAFVLQQAEIVATATDVSNTTKDSKLSFRTTVNNATSAKLEIDSEVRSLADITIQDSALAGYGIKFIGNNGAFSQKLQFANPTLAAGVITVPSKNGTMAVTSDIGNATITIIAGTDLSTGGNFTTNATSNKSITVNHANVSRTDTTSTDAPAHGGTFTAVDSVTTSTTGHVTAINVKTVTIPAESDTLDSVTGRGNTTSNSISIGDLTLGHPDSANTAGTASIFGPGTIVIDPTAAGSTGKVWIRGDLEVEGTTTTINSTEVTIDDINITLASGAADATAADGAGITIDGASATIEYDATTDGWHFNKPLYYAGNQIATVGQIPSDTLADVVARGATTTGSITVGNTLTVGTGSGVATVTTKSTNTELVVQPPQYVGHGNGLPLKLYSGLGGTSSGNGGALTVQAGNGSGAGGTVQITAGSSTAGGGGGDMIIAAGGGGYQGGALSLRAGNNTLASGTRAAGGVIINAGHAVDGQTNVSGGDILITNGRGTGSAGGGDILFRVWEPGTSGTTLNANTIDSLTIDGVTGQVGIFNTAPQYSLDVNGTVNVGTDLTANTATINATLTANTAHFALTGTNGLVGIGTNAPTDLTAGQPDGRHDPAAWNKAIHLHNSNTGNVGAGLKFTRSGNTANGAQIGINNYNNFVIYNTENAGIALSTNATERLFIDNAGTSTFTGDAVIYKAAASPTLLTLHNYQTDIDGAGTALHGNFIDFKMTDDNATFTPQVRVGMVIKDYSGDAGIASEGAGNFVVYTGQGTDALGGGALTEVFRATENGKVLVGRTDDYGSYNLQVNGGIAAFGASVFDAVDVFQDLTANTVTADTVLSSPQATFGWPAFTPTAGVPLHIRRGSLLSSSGVTDLIKLEGNRDDFGVDPAGIAILFQDQDTNNATNTARIKMMTVNDVDYGDNDESASNLIFETTNGGVAGDKMIITGRGAIGMGTLNPNRFLDVRGDVKISTGSGGTILELNRNNTNTTGAIGTINFTALDGHSVAAIVALGDGDDEGADLVFKGTSTANTADPFTGTTEWMRIKGSDGTITAQNLTISKEGTTGTKLSGISSISFRDTANTWTDPAFHGIRSVDSAGNFGDDLAINSYQDVTIRLDTNNNNAGAYLRVYNDVTNNTGELPFWTGVNADNVTTQTRIWGFLGVNAEPNATGSYVINMGGSIDMNANNIDYVTQLHFNDNVRFIDDGNDSYLNYKFGDAATGGIRFQTGAGTQCGYVYTDSTSANFGLLNKDGQWAVRTTATQTSMYYDGTEKLVTTTEGVKLNAGGTTTTELHIDSGGHANIEIDRASTSYDNNILFSTAGGLKWRIWQDAGDNILQIRNEVAATNVVTFTDTKTAFADDVSVNGLLTATQKSFTIDHPTKEGYKLRYGSLEGPENGVYVRGRLQGTNTIELPEYWPELVDADTITVQLTSNGAFQKLYVKEIKDNKVIIGNASWFSNKTDCFYVVYGERKDVAKLDVEFKA